MFINIIINNFSEKRIYRCSCEIIGIYEIRIFRKNFLDYRVLCFIIIFYICFRDLGKYFLNYFLKLRSI